MNEFVTRRALQARKRALVKTVAYRVVMVLITVSIAWLVVGDTNTALQIGFASNLVNHPAHGGAGLVSELGLYRY